MIFFLRNGIAVKFLRMSKKLSFNIAAQLKMLGKKWCVEINGGGGVRSIMARWSKLNYIVNKACFGPPNDKCNNVC